MESKLPLFNVLFIVFFCIALLSFSVMLFIIFLIAICVFLNLYKIVECKKINLTSSFYIFGLILSLLFSIISFSMESVSDFKVYQEIYSFTITHGVDFSYRGGEFGYLILVYLIGILCGSDPEVAHLSVLFISNVIFFCSLYRFNSRYCLFVFFALQIYSILWINPYLSRQFLSFSILLLALSFDSSKKRYLLFFISTFIHFSSLIFIVSFFISKYVLKRKLDTTIALFFCIGSSLFLSLDFILEILSHIDLPLFISAKLGFYERLNDINTASFDYPAYMSICIIIILKTLTFRIEMSKRDAALVNVFFISALVQLLLFNIPVMPTRLGFLTYYLSLYVFVVVFNYLYAFKFFEKMGVIFLGAGLIFISIYKLYVNDFSLPWILISDGNIFGHGIFYYM